MAHRDHAEQDDAASAYAPPARQPDLRRNPSMVTVAALVLVALAVVVVVLLLG